MLPSLFKDKLLLLLLLSSTFLSSCWNNKKDDPAPKVIQEGTSDPYAAEKAKQWKPTFAGEDKASFLMNGKAYNISRMFVVKAGNFSLTFLPNRIITSPADELPFTFGFALGTKDMNNLRQSYFPNFIGRSNDTTVTYNILPRDTGSYVIKLPHTPYDISPFTHIPTAIIAKQLDSRNGTGRGWIKITNYGVKIPQSNRVLFPCQGTFEMEFFEGKDTIKITNGWFDVNLIS